MTPASRTARPRAQPSHPAPPLRDIPLATTPGRLLPSGHAPTASGPARGRDRLPRADAGDRRGRRSAASRSGIDVELQGDHLVVAHVTPLQPRGGRRRRGRDDRRRPERDAGLPLAGERLREPSTDPDQPPPDPNVAPEPIGVEPAVPTAVAIPTEMAQLTGSPTAGREHDRDHAERPRRRLARRLLDPRLLVLPAGWRDTLLPLRSAVAAARRAGCSLRTGGSERRSSRSRRRSPVAVATPFLDSAARGTWEVTAVVGAGLLIDVAMLPLADGALGADPGRVGTALDRPRDRVLRDPRDLRDVRDRPAAAGMDDRRSCAGRSSRAIPLAARAGRRRAARLRRAALAIGVERPPPPVGRVRGRRGHADVRRDRARSRRPVYLPLRDLAHRGSRSRPAGSRSGRWRGSLSRAQLQRDLDRRGHRGRAGARSRPTSTTTRSRS